MIREAVAKLGIDVDSKGVDSLMSALDLAKGKLEQFVKLLVAGEAVSFVKETIGQAAALDKQAEKLGINVDQLQRFQYAVARTGGDAESATHILYLFNRSLGNAGESGGEAAQLLAKWGVSLKDSSGHVRTANELLPDIAEHIKNAGSEAEATAIATKFFGRNTIEVMGLLHRGKAGLDELNASYDQLGGGLSQEVTKGARAVSSEMSKLSFIQRALTATMVSALYPAISIVVNWLSRLATSARNMAAHTNVLKTGLALLAVLMGGKLINTLGMVSKALALMRVNLFGMAVPLLPIVFLIGGLYLLLDDLYTLMKGGDSIIGRAFDKFGDAGSKKKFIEDLKKAWEDLKKAFNDSHIIDSVMGLFKEAGATTIPALASALMGTVKFILAAATGLGGMIKAINELSKGGDHKWDNAMNALSSADDAIFGKQNSYQDKNGTVSERVGGIFGITNDDYNSRVKAMSGSATGQSTQTLTANTALTSTMNIGVVQLSDPKDAARLETEHAKQIMNQNAAALKRLHATLNGERTEGGGF